MLRRGQLQVTRTMISTSTNTTAKAPAVARDFERLTYTLADAAAASSLSIATLRRHAKAGRLALHRVGGRTLVSSKSLRALLGVEA
jgi:hypothetical protein